MEKLYKDMEELKKANPNEHFRAIFCKKGKEWVIQQKCSDGWLCLHD